MNNKNKTRFLLAVTLILLVALTAMQSFAGERPTQAPPFERFQVSGPSGIEKEAPEIDPLNPLAGERVWPTDPNPFPMPDIVAPSAVEGEVCYQLLANTELDVIDFGDGTGSAEPWVVVWSKVYFDDTIYNSPSYSLFLVIGDSGDPTPSFDAFGQAFNMPNDLNSVTINYSRRIDFANAIDNVTYELWTVDSQGYLDEFITGFNVADTPAGWQNRMGQVTDPGDLSAMEGRLMALVFANNTTDTSPGEVAYIDDISLTACYNPPPGSSYVPFIAYNAGSGPVCIPPSESPPDGWYNDRGLTETQANCNSSLSTLDDRDYYSYIPTQSGNHTIHLRNLPNGSNWAALVYNDTEPPPSGPTNGGTCFTSAPGSADKSVVCNLTAGQKYVIKVSAGSTPMNGTYNMQVTKP